jgi:hypothetical protein
MGTYKFLLIAVMSFYHFDTATPPVIETYRFDDPTKCQNAAELMTKSLEVLVAFCIEPEKIMNSYNSH